MKKKNHSKAKFYLKWAAAFGIVGWSTFFLAGFLAVIGQQQAAIYMGAFSIFIGWFVSGYFWLRLGLIEGKSLKDIILRKKK